MGPLRLAIVGLGFGATVHLPAFLSIPGVEVVAVADSGSGNAQRVAEAFEIPHAFNDWKSLLKDALIDALSVATPPAYQAEIVCAGLTAGKHILCEKPFGMNRGEAARMFELAQKHPQVNAVDFEYRMEPGIFELKRQVEGGTIGRVQRMNVVWFTKGRPNLNLPWSWQHDAELGGGVLDSYGSHILDYVEWIGGNRITTVFAKSHRAGGYRKDMQGRQREVTAEDGCDLICDLESGGIANLSFSNGYSFVPGHRIEVYGDQGRLVYTHETPFTQERAQLCVETNSGGGLRPLPLPVDPLTPASDPRVFLFRRLASRFLDAAVGLPVSDLPDFRCALRVRTLLEAARESLWDRKQVVVSSMSSLHGQESKLRGLLSA